MDEMDCQFLGAAMKGRKERRKKKDIAKHSSIHPSIHRSTLPSYASLPSLNHNHTYYFILSVSP